MGYRFSALYVPMDAVLTGRASCKYALLLSAVVMCRCTVENIFSGSAVSTDRQTDRQSDRHVARLTGEFFVPTFLSEHTGSGPMSVNFPAGSTSLYVMLNCSRLSRPLFRFR